MGPLLRHSVILLLAMLLPWPALAQEEEGRTFNDIFELKGYIKHMNVGSWTEDNIGLLQNQNFFHNRLNFRAYPIEELTLAVEARNRLFYGEAVSRDRHFGDRILGQYPQRFDMEDLLVNEPSLVLISKIDRAYLRFSKGKFDITAGRQRINWGLNLVWNPNDLFNAYSFFDFDYEERPGSDAIRIQYFPKMMTSLDLAVRPGEDEDDWVAALKYKFNKFNYDFQVLGGQYYTDYALGLGWAGNIKNAGFKGEATYFHPRDNWQDTLGAISAALTYDYVFPNSLYLAGSVLWNSEGTDSPPQYPRNFFTGRQLTAKTLMPTEFSIMGQVSGNITPILKGSFSPIWSPGSNALFFMPSLTYSIKENWDLSLFGQTFFIETQQEFRNLGNGVFLRLQWSF